MKVRIVILIVFSTSIFSCKKDFLDREPLSELSPNSSFGSENGLKLYTNSFYDLLPSGPDIYEETADNIVVDQLTPTLTGNRNVPVTGGGWNWDALRNINFFLQNYSKGNLSENFTAPYVGAAKFFRAYFYFNKVKQFGDVPWYSQAINANDSVLLHQKRDSRILVVDSILSDLNDAIKMLPSGRTSDKISKWTAMALKSRVCLYEGTWRKYHKDDVFGKDLAGKALTGWEDLLQQCVDISDSLMEFSGYTIYHKTASSYEDLFTSQQPQESEVILARTFDLGLQIDHSVNYYTLAPSYGKPGLNKDLVNSYLMKDGSRFTNIPQYDTAQFYTETQNRDPRLSQTIRTPGYSRIGTTNQVPPSFGSSSTGYQLIKFVTEPIHDNINGSVNSIPVFRFAEVLLNYAEAKAELGTLTQEDIDKSIKILRDRVNMPNLDLQYANANPDPYLEAEYPNVPGDNKGVILEIRRERRIELVMEGFRWDDLMRWKAGQLIAKQFYGQYFPGPGEYDLDKNGSIDVVLYTGQKPPAQSGVQFYELGSEINLKNGSNGGYVVVNGSISKTFNEDRDYLNPLPTQDLLLNTNLQQNPGW